jgi:deoxyribonuclease IV
MPLFGAHMSVAGGLHHALEAARDQGCPAVQLFTSNANRWQGRPVSDSEVALFRRTRRACGVRVAVAHDSYLINLASPDDVLYRRSIEALLGEWTRAEQLGLNFLVIHPGAHLGSGEQVGLTRIARALDEVHERVAPGQVRVLLETTAGQGTTLGHRFEHLAAILKEMRAAARVGVCLDTCHVFAAGYSLSPEAEYRTTMRAFDKVLGLEQLRLFHLNDSLKPLGSRVDRHAHIGRGYLGLAPFRLIVNDRRFRTRAMILETAKEEGDETDMDAVNLATLRGLVLPAH